MIPGMQSANYRRRLMTNVSSVVIGIAVLVVAACTRKEAPQLQPAAAPPPPPPAVPIVKDAAAAVDAASDAGDAHGSGARKWVGTPPAAGSGGGLKVEGSLSRADGEKVMRGAQGKLR